MRYEIDNLRDEINWSQNTIRLFHRMKVEISKNDSEERVNRVEHVFEVIQLTTKDQNAKLSICKKYHHEHNYE